MSLFSEHWAPKVVARLNHDESRLWLLRPLVAWALALAAGIWTIDNDLLSTGVATWTTERLKVWLTRNPTG